MKYCKKYPTDKVLPDENNKCSLCGGDCTGDKQITGYVVTIQFNGEPEPISGYIIKVGSFEEETETEQEKIDDQNIFFYIDSPEHIEDLKKEGAEDFVVLSAEPIYN